jgi:type IV pilus assembly protein PilB
VAIEAALTGHKVYTTFHTEDSVGALLRLMDMQIETFLIASTVVSVVAQRLLRRICPECRQRYTPPAQVLKALGLEFRDIAGAEFYRGTGCALCHHTGYRGRTGIYEILFLDPMIKDAILQKKPSYEIRRLCTGSQGFVTMLEDGICKAIKNITTFEDVLQNAPRVSKPRPISQILSIIEGTTSGGVQDAD